MYKLLKYENKVHVFGQRPQVPFLLLSPLGISDYSFFAQHLGNRHDRHLLARGGVLRLLRRMAD
jgi:hypothetical protein